MRYLSMNDFPVKSYDKIRYRDTDKQGHVNNAVFSTFFETGRVEILYNPQYDLLDKNCSYVIASLKIDFLKEVKWPGNVEVGTGILKIGKSSINFYQILFQNGEAAASAETVIVQVNNEKGKSSPLTENAIQTLKRWLINIH